MIEIIFRFVIVTLKNFVDWSNMMLKIQRKLNNSLISIERTLNETFYDFISIQSFDFMSKQKLFFIVDVAFEADFRFAQRIIRFEIIDVIIFDQMQFKFHYDNNHKSLFMKINEWTFFRLYKSYKVSIIARIKKYFQQYVDSFQIIEKNRIIRLSFNFIKALTHTICFHCDSIEIDIVVKYKFFSSL